MTATSPEGRVSRWQVRKGRNKFKATFARMHRDGKRADKNYLEQLGRANITPGDLAAMAQGQVLGRFDEQYRAAGQAATERAAAKLEAADPRPSSRTINPGKALVNAYRRQRNIRRGRKAQKAGFAQAAVEAMRAGPGILDAAGRSPITPEDLARLAQGQIDQVFRPDSVLAQAAAAQQAQQAAPQAVSTQDQIAQVQADIARLEAEQQQLRDQQAQILAQQTQLQAQLAQLQAQNAQPQQTQPTPTQAQTQGQGPAQPAPAQPAQAPAQPAQALAQPAQAPAQPAAAQPAQPAQAPAQPAQAPAQPAQAPAQPAQAPAQPAAAQPAQPAPAQPAQAAPGPAQPAAAAQGDPTRAWNAVAAGNGTPALGEPAAAEPVQATAAAGPATNTQQLPDRVTVVDGTLQSQEAMKKGALAKSFAVAFDDLPKATGAIEGQAGEKGEAADPGKGTGRHRGAAETKGPNRHRKGPGNEI